MTSTNLWPAFLLAVLAHCNGVGTAVPDSRAADDDFAKRREAMVRNQIEARGVQDPEVLAAIRSVPRHEFVPADMLPAAHADHPLPIGHGQTISQPYIVAYMTAALEIEPGGRVLEIGTGSGYQAAVLAKLASKVYSIEIVEPLGREAQRRLERLGYDNVQVRIGDGYQGWPEEAPFDRILLTAAPPELPAALVEQLAQPGRLIAPVGPRGGVQNLIVVEKDSTGKVTRRADLAVRFVPMVRGPR